MRPRNTFIASGFVLAICATLVCSASLLAKGPPKNATTVDLLVAPGTPPCTELAEVTGVVSRFRFVSASTRSQLRSLSPSKTGWRRLPAGTATATLTVP